MITYNVGDVVSSWFAEGRCRENGVVMRISKTGAGNTVYGVTFPTAPIQIGQGYYWETVSSLKPVKNWRRIRTPWIREEIASLIEQAKQQPAR